MFGDTSSVKIILSNSLTETHLFYLKILKENNMFSSYYFII